MLNYRFEKWLLYLTLTWVLSAGVDQIARTTMPHVIIEFPNGVSLGYNLYVLFYAGAISLATAIFVTPFPRPRLRFIIGTTVGCLAGYLGFDQDVGQRGSGQVLDHLRYYGKYSLQK